MMQCNQKGNRLLRAKKERSISPVNTALLLDGMGGNMHEILAMVKRENIVWPWMILDGLYGAERVQK